MNLKNTKIGIIGLGYVGLPLALEFSSKFPVVGFDISTQRILDLKEGKDFIADLLNLYEEDKELNHKVRDAMKPVFESWAGRKYFDDFSDEDIQAITLKARNLALDQLVNRENS